jgi:Na+/proline symporter
MIIIAIYSLTGGLKSVILTDQVQGFIIILSSIFFVSYLGTNKPAIEINLTNINFDIKTSFYLFLGSILLTISSHGGDQDILQRVFSVEKFIDAQKSLILSGIISSLVILLFFLSGYLLTYDQNLNPKSPLLDFVLSLDSSNTSQIIKSFFLVVLMAASMSTLDSSIHSTGAIWKSILMDFNKNYPNYIYSFISLIIMMLLSFSFIYLHTQKDFLSFALGFMNYVNGTLFAVVTIYIIYKKKLNSITILSILITNIFTTIICEYFSLYFALTTIISFFLAFFIGFLFMYYYEKNPN